MKKFFPILILFFVVAVFFRPFFLQNKLPIPADTIVGLYHPFRDLYAADYPRGIPFKNFLITDPVRQQYPWKSLAIEEEKKLELPLWNPYSMAGSPLLGSMQSGALYPLNFLLFIFDSPVGWSLLILSQQILAGAFLYLYLNNLRLNKFASFLGGIVYAFSGFFIAWLEWGTVVHVALWTPLILLSIDKISKYTFVKASRDKQINNIQLKKKLLNWSLVFIFALISSFFAGHLQTFFYLFLLSSAYFLSRWLQFGKKKQLLFLYLILNTLFLILSSVQWFPTLQLILQSARDIDQMNWQIEGWFVPWQHLIQFVAPDFFGNPTTLNYWGVWNYAEFVGYVGIAPLVLAFFALFFRRDKKTLFFASFLLLGLAFSLPTLLAQVPYILKIPFLASSQPTRLLFVVDFSLAVLTALGFDFYLRQKKKINILYPLASFGVIFLFLWLFVLGGYKSIFSVSLENILVAKRNLYVPTLIFGVTLLIITCGIFIRNKKINVILICLLLGLSIVDLLRFSEKFTPFTNKRYLFPQTSAISFLQKDTSIYRITATDSQILPPNFSVIYKLQSLDGYDPLYLRRYGELIAANERNKPDIHSPFGFNRIITPHNIDSRLIDLLGVKYILSLSEINSPKYEKVFTEGQTKIYENKEVFPRAFFVNKVKSVSNKQEAINALFDEKIDLKTTAIVEGADIDSENFSTGSASINKYWDNKVIITTINEQSSLLVFMDTFYPTWHAKICSDSGNDCKESAIYRTNYNFRGIVVPAGKHTVILYNTLL